MPFRLRAVRDHQPGGDGVRDRVILSESGVEAIVLFLLHATDLERGARPLHLPLSIASARLDPTAFELEADHNTFYVMEAERRESFARFAVDAFRRAAKVPTESGDSLIFHGQDVGAFRGASLIPGGDTSNVVLRIPTASGDIVLKSYKFLDSGNPRPDPSEPPFGDSVTSLVLRSRYSRNPPVCHEPNSSSFVRRSRRAFDISRAMWVARRASSTRTCIWRRSCDDGPTASFCSSISRGSPREGPVSGEGSCLPSATLVACSDPLPTSGTTSFAVMSAGPHPRHRFPSRPTSRFRKGLWWNGSDGGRKTCSDGSRPRTSLIRRSIIPSTQGKPVS